MKITKKEFENFNWAKGQVGLVFFASVTHYTGISKRRLEYIRDNYDSLTKKYESKK